VFAFEAECVGFDGGFGVGRWAWRGGLMAERHCERVG
jgi:hypothetical protein